LAELKLVPTLGDLDLANLTGPIIDVLKQMSVNGLKVLQVEVPLGRTFLDTQLDQLAFGPIKLGLAAYA
jgi:hypothetical protein